MPANRLLEMDAFVRVARARSFLTAARELAASPALVTRRVQQLEADLGVRVLNRTTREVSLTDAGARYFDFCVRILAEVEEEERALKALTDSPSGRLNVVAPMSFGTMEMGKAVTSFMLAYPDVEVTLTVGDNTRNTFDPRGYGADVLIRFTRPRESSLLMRQLGRMAWYACASPAYLARAGEPRTPRDLLAHSCLVTTRPFASGGWRFTGPQGAQTVKVSGIVAPGSAIAMRYMTLDGAGVALLPAFCVAQDIAEGRLTRVLADYAAPEQSIRAFYSQAARERQVVRLFLKYLAARFRAQDWGGA